MRNFTVDKLVTGSFQGTLTELNHLVKSYNSLVSLWNNQLYPLLADLPDVSSETRWRLPDKIQARTQADGANIFVDNAAVSGSSKYFEAESRPYTLKEILVKLGIPNESQVFDGEITIYHEDSLQGIVTALDFDLGFSIELVSGVAYIAAGISVYDDGDLVIGRGQVDVIEAGIGLTLDAPSETVMRIALDTSAVIETQPGETGSVPDDCVTQDDLVQVGPGTPGQVPILNEQGEYDLGFFDFAAVGVPADEGKPILTNELGFYPIAAWGVEEVPVGSQPIITDINGYVSKELMPLYAGDISGAWGNARVMGLNGWPLDASVLTPSDGDGLVFRSPGEYVSEPLPGPANRSGHVADANSVVLWRMNDTIGSTTVTDASGNGRHGVRNPSYTFTTSGPFPGVKALEFPGRRAAPGIHSPVVYTGDNSPFRLTGEMTFECWLFIYSGGTAGNDERYLVACASDTPGAKQTSDNILYAIILQKTGSSGVYALHYWHRTGSSYVPTPVGFFDYGYAVAYYVITPQQWHHFAFRRSANGGNFDIDFFIDGVEQRFATNIAGPTGGTSSRIQVGHLNWPTSFGSNQLNNAFGGIIAEVHLSNVARSDSYILQDYQRGAGIL